MATYARWPRPKRPLHQLSIALILTLVATLAVIHFAQAFIPVFTPPTSQATPPPAIQKILNGKRKIVTLGDSITEAGKFPGGYVWLLQRYLNALYPDKKIEIVNAGMSGHKSTDMQARFQRDVIDQKPDLVTINVGVNDVWHAFFDFKTKKMHPEGELSAGIPLTIYQQKLTQMVVAAKAAGIRPVLLSPTPIREELDGPENLRLAKYIAAMRQVAEENQCRFIDLNAVFREVIATYQKHAGRTYNLLAADGVHPNPAGNRIIAFTLLRGLGVPAQDLASLDIKK